MPARAAIAVRAEMEPCFAIHPPLSPVQRWGTPAQVITARMRGAGWCKQHVCVFARPPWHVSGSGLDRACRDRARTALELTAPPTQPRTCTQAVDVTKKWTSAGEAKAADPRLVCAGPVHQKRPAGMAGQTASAHRRPARTGYRCETGREGKCSEVKAARGSGCGTSGRIRHSAPRPPSDG